MDKPKGRTGVEISSGIIQRPFIPSTILSDDYNSDWTIERIQQMMRGDGEVAAVCNSIRLALRQSDFNVVPYLAPGEKKPSNEDRDIAQFVEKCIEPHETSLIDMASDYLWYGFMLFEPIYRIEDGQAVWDRFSPRMPWTVEGWTPKDGHVGSVKQYVWDDKKGYTYFDIPGKDLLRFTFNQRGENFEGESFLRGAHKHWLMKNSLYKIVQIGLEKLGAGTLVGALPEGATPEQEDAFKEYLQDYRVNEKGYLYLGPIANADLHLDQIITVLGPKGGQAFAEGAMEVIRHHDVLIARSMMMEFLNLGETNSGTRALSGDKVDLFLMNLEAITKDIANVVSRGHRGENEGIKTLVDKNFKNVRGYPTWKCGRTKKTDLAAISAVVAQLVQSGAMEPDDTLEDYLRGRIGISKEKQNTRSVKDMITRVRKDQQKTSDNVEQNSEQFAEVERRLPFEHERFTDFDAIEQGLDSAEEEVIRTWRDVFARQLDILSQEFGNTITREDASKINTLAMPLTGELANRIENIFVRMYRQGQLSVKQELMRQSGLQGSATFSEEDDLDEEEALLLLAVQATAAAERLSERVRDAVKASIVAGLLVTATLPWENVRGRVWNISDRLYGQPEAAFVNNAFGEGRNEAIGRYDAQGLIAERYYSALMDACDVCLPMDGTRYSDQPFSTPNPGCLSAMYSKSGANSCRCLTIIEMTPGATI